MRLIYFIAAFGALVTSCGQKTLDCKPRTVNVTGVLETDILGSWDNDKRSRSDIRVVTTFHAGGRVTTVVDPPNYGSHDGIIGDFFPDADYRVVDGGVIMNGIEFSASIDEHSLTLSDPSGSGRFGSTLPALTCTGKEFD